MWHLSDIDWYEPGEWPCLVKIISLLLLGMLVWGSGYYFWLNDKQARLYHLQQQQFELKSLFESKQAVAANLRVYQQQLVEMNALFAEVLAKLPEKSEVPALLREISRIGLFYGLSFELFKPEKEVAAGFYAELPIRISVMGNYHQLAQFISELASLARIVTFEDLHIEAVNKDEANRMNMTLTAKTYRFLHDK